MNKTVKILVVVVVVAAAAVVLVFKPGKTPPPQAPPAVPAPPAAVTAPVPAPASLPTLVDLGAGKCTACKMMTPVLEELRTEYQGRMRVDFIDVWENPEAGEKYGIRVIPTQIFQAPDGRELFRHEGFMSKEDILAKWTELSVEIK